MAGQGSLRHGSPRLGPDRVPAWSLFVFWLSLGFLIGESQACADDPMWDSVSDGDIVDVELRWQWTSPTPIHWNLEATAVDTKLATILDVRDDGASEKNTSKSELIRSDDQSRFRLNTPTATTSGGVVFRLRCTTDGVLKLIRSDQAIRSNQAAGDEVVEIAVQKLLAGEAIESSGNTDETPTWSVRRVESDTIRIRVGTSESICKPDQPIDLAVCVNSLSSHASATVMMKYGFYEVARGQMIHTGQKTVKLDTHGNSPPITIHDNVLHDEGVYEFRCEIESEHDKLWSRLRRRESAIASRRETVVVISRQLAPELVSESNWSTVNVIRPSETTWSVDQWLPKQATRLIPGVTGVSGELSTNKYDGENVSVLNPLHVFQTSLPTMVPHLPHKISLRYPADLDGPIQVDVASGEDRSSAMVSFVLDADDHPLIDAGEANQSVPSKRWRKHTFAYYPGGNDQIWITNLSDKDVVRFESIRIEAGPKRLAKSSVNVPRQRDVILRLDNLNWVDSLSGDIERSDRLRGCSTETAALYRTWIATERLADYATIHNISSVAVPLCNDQSAWFKHENPFAFAWNDGHDRDRMKLFLHMIEKQRVRALVCIDPTILAKNVSNANHASALIISLVQDWKESPAFTGLIITANRAPAVPEIAPGNLSELISAIRKQTESDLRIFVRSNANHQVPKEPATVDDIANVNFIAVRPFVHDVCEGLSMQSELSHRLSSARRSTPSANGAAALGQISDTNVPVRLCNQLDLDACQIIDCINPHTLIVELPLTTSAILTRLSRVLHAFASMPTDGSRMIEPVDVASQSVDVRLSESGGNTYVALINLAPWSNVVTFHSSSPAQWEVISGDVKIEERQSSASLDRQMAIEPGGVSVIRCRGTDVGFGNWSAAPQGGAATVETIKQQVTSVVQRIGLLSSPPAYDALVNGGFEQSGGMGLVGWLHAQHPPQCVQIEPGECIEGRQSVRLTTDAALANRTWLVSETVSPPSSGRLAVSIACRGELKNEDDFHRLRVSLEATQNGQPIRQSARRQHTLQRDVAIPRNRARSDRDRSRKNSIAAFDD